MPNIAASQLIDLTKRIFVAHGVPVEVARDVADSLVLGNLKGHDSHGVIRIIEYVDWLAKGWIDPHAELEVLSDDGAILVVDGHSGFGQVIGRKATELAIEKSKVLGACILTLRHSAHLGRVGEFAEIAAAAGVMHLSLTNTHGGGVLVAPHGGCERRLSANPIVGGAPVPGRDPVIMDMATSTIAEGKLKVARAKGESVDPGLFVDASGEIGTDPNSQYYTDPPGALLPMAAHKGFAISVFAELFAGALGGGSCSRPDQAQIANGWFAIFIDPARFSGQEFYNAESSRFYDWVKTSRPREGFSEVCMPGEPEARALADRSKNGIPIDEGTWAKISNIAKEARIELPVV